MKRINFIMAILVILMASPAITTARDLSLDYYTQYTCFTVYDLNNSRPVFYVRNTGQIGSKVIQICHVHEDFNMSTDCDNLTWLAKEEKILDMDDITNLLGTAPNDISKVCFQFVDYFTYAAFGENNGAVDFAYQGFSENGF